MGIVENNIKIFVTRECFNFSGINDLGMLHIVMILSTWETLTALYSEKVRLTSDKKVRRSNALGSQITA